MHGHERAIVGSEGGVLIHFVEPFYKALRHFLQANKVGVAVLHQGDYALLAILDIVAFEPDVVRQYSD